MFRFIKINATTALHRCTSRCSISLISLICVSMHFSRYPPTGIRSSAERKLQPASSIMKDAASFKHLVSYSSCNIDTRVKCMDSGQPVASGQCLSASPRSRVGASTPRRPTPYLHHNTLSQSLGAPDRSTPEVTHRARHIIPIHRSALLAMSRCLR